MTEEQYIKIRQQTGCFNLADPSDETEQITVSINDEDFDFKHSFSFEAGDIDVRGMSWMEAIDHMSCVGPRGIKGGRKMDELEEWLDDNIEKVREEWRTHRLDKVNSKISRLEEEKRDLEKNLNVYESDPFGDLLDLVMVSDPWPLEDEQRGRIVARLNEKAESRGYSDWKEAYHEMSQSLTE